MECCLLASTRSLLVLNRQLLARLLQILALDEDLLAERKLITIFIRTFAWSSTANIVFYVKKRIIQKQKQE